MVTYYFRVLCFDYKVISVEYFLNEMTLSELPIILQQLQFTDRSLWETTRLQCLIYAQKNCRKKLTATDIFTLPWDTNTTPTDKDIEQLRAHKDEMEALVNAHAQTHKTE